MVFFFRIPVVLENRRSSQEGGAHPLHPPRSAPGLRHSETGNMTVADPGEGPGGAGTPLFSDETVARRAKKKNFGDRSPRLTQGLDDRLPPPPPSPPPYLKVWIRY